jgi:hypothetical protein
MTWKYHIIKDGNRFYLGEVFRGKKEVWGEIPDTSYNTKEELLMELFIRLKDAFHNKVRVVKNNKLV